METVECPLCGADLDDTQLPAHLTQCPERDRVSPLGAVKHGSRPNHGTAPPGRLAVAQSHIYNITRNAFPRAAGRGSPGEDLSRRRI